MSELAKLLASRKPSMGATNSARAANPHVEISNLSEISSGPSRKLSFQLEQRLRQMATRWHYSDEDLATTLDLAAANPDAWTRAVALDERREAEFRADGRLPRCEA